MPDRLLYMAHTSPAVRRQALYSALSALAHAGHRAPAIHVYTDEPAAFSRLGARAAVTELPRATFEAWALPAGYNHRAKPAAIRHLAGRHPGDRILFSDADTVFAGPPSVLFDRIEPGAAVMHHREYNVGTSDLAVMHRFRRHLRRATFRGAPVALHLDMWNSGAVGLHPALLPLVDDWLAYLDEVFPQVKRWVLEQYALVSVLEQRGVAIREASDVLVHYWFDKDAYCAAADAALERTAPWPLDDALAYVREHAIARPRLPPAAAYGKPANFFQRTFGW